MPSATVLLLYGIVFLTHLLTVVPVQRQMNTVATFYATGVQRMLWIISKISTTLLLSVAYQFSKFHEILSITFWVILLTDRQTYGSKHYPHQPVADIIKIQQGHIQLISKFTWVRQWCQKNFTITYSDCWNEIPSQTNSTDPTIKNPAETNVKTKVNLLRFNV